ncbi:unnamed protein product [Lampetra planeri]
MGKVRSRAEEEWVGTKCMEQRDALGATLRQGEVVAVSGMEWDVVVVVWGATWWTVEVAGDAHLVSSQAIGSGLRVAVGLGAPH